MVERTLNLTYKRQPLRVTLEADGAWVPAEDVVLAIGLRDTKGPVSKVPEHEKSLRQIGGRGVRMRVLSVEGAQRLAGSTRVAGAADFLDWFRAQAMPQISLALQDIASEEEPIKDPALEAAVMVSGLVLDAGHAFLYDKLSVRLQVDADGEILFRAEDVCQALEMGNPRQAIDSHVDPEDVQKLDTLTAGGAQQVNYVNLSGLYALIFGSKKEAARRFKRWVTHDVLPTIGRTGSYNLNAQTAPMMGSRTQSNRMQEQVNRAALVASQSGSGQSQAAYIQMRQEVARVNQATHALRGYRVEIGFTAGLERPVAVAHLPATIETQSADKSMTGRLYLLTFQGVSKPHLRAVLTGEYIVKANMDGIKMLANRCVMTQASWEELQHLAQYKINALKNKAGRADD